MRKDRTAAAAGATRAILLALTLASVIASCASHRGRVLSFGSRTYDVITCPGALEDDVRCDEGYFPVGRFDDGVVCSDVDAPERFAEAKEVCKLLPHGCTCTKSDAFCHPPLTSRERMLEHGPPHTAPVRCRRPRVWTDRGQRSVSRSRGYAPGPRGIWPRRRGTPRAPATPTETA